MEKSDSVGRDWVSAGLRRQVRINALICAVCAVAFVTLISLDSPLLQRLELFSGDWLTDQRGGGKVDEQLVLVGIDHASLNVLDILGEKLVEENPQLDAMSYGWEFPRSVYAELAQKLLDAGARLVIFDMVFSKEHEGDDSFKAVIDANPGQIVVGCNMDQRTYSETDAAKKVTTVFPSSSLIELAGSQDPRVGHVNFYDDFDSRVRKLNPLIWRFNHGDEPPYHSLTVAALEQMGLGSRIDANSGELHIRFPRFSGQDGAYQPVPFYTLFVPYDWEKSYDNGAAFRGKIVYVGGSSIVDFHDEVLIPEGTVLGVQLQMSALAAALNGDFYELAGSWRSIFLIALMALTTFGIAFVLKHPLLGLLILVGCGAIYIAAVRWFYFDFNILLPSAAPMLTLLLAGIGCFGSRYALELVEKARLRRTLERQVSKELADHILSVPEDYFQSLPGVRKPVTVLFSDIRSFTARSEKDDPVELVSQLKEYLDAMGKIVFEHGGVVDKFIGDAVMAVWGNLRSNGPEEDTRNAVAAAVSMHRRLAELNAGWIAAGREPFKIGIGLNHGEALFGMMGSEQKQEMTVIGDPVNQAARLESLTKKFALETIIGERVVQILQGQFVLRSLGKVRTMGKEEAEELAGVLGEAAEDFDEGESEWLENYRRALAAFQAGDLEEAGKWFRACADERPEDRTCVMYLEAIDRGDRGGVLVMTGK